MRPISITTLTFSLSWLQFSFDLTRAAPSPPELHAGIQLSESNFDQSIKNGLWLIEHYSPFCVHCKHFAPTWVKLCEAVKPFETRGLHMAQVDCIAQGDLCVKNNVEFYPQMKLYTDGVFLETYEGSKKLGDLTAYLDKQSNQYLSNKTSTNPSSTPIADPASHTEPITKVPPPQASTDDQTHTAHDDQLKPIEPIKTKQPEPQIPEDIKALPNQDGKLISLTPETWQSHTATGPIFVKYYAPWCGHCQRLAPTWSDLARLLIHHVNVAEFNCDEKGDFKALCRKEGVPGFPTLFFYQDGIKVEYVGPRTLTAMEGFAKKASITGGARDISSSTLRKVMSEEEVFFLYLYDQNLTPKHDLDALQEAAKSMLGTAIVYKSHAPELFRQFGIPSTSIPTLLVFKDLDEQPWSSTSPNKTGLKPWISSNSLPIMPEMSEMIYDSVLKPNVRKLVVLVCLPGGKNQALLDELKGWAKQWRRSQQAREVDVVVDWVWVDGNGQWAGWLNNVYGVKVGLSSAAADLRQESRIIIVDGIKKEYYDHQANDVRITWNPTSVFQTLLAIELGKVEPKIFGSLIDRSISRLRKSSIRLIGTIQTHWIASMTIFLGIIALMFKKTRMMHFFNFFRNSQNHPDLEHFNQRNGSTLNGNQKNPSKFSPKAD
ncbi:thioredoxin-like protein [Melampsora americana]|nr:thioredoxin-like protein [Melampsora americana]